MPDFIPAVEMIYRELARPKAPEIKPPLASEIAKKAELSRVDVNAILQRRRATSAVELEQIIANARDYKLTEGERQQLSVALTIEIARARQSKRREDPNARFIAQVLGYLETPFGLIERSFMDDLLRAGSENIARCRNHRPPNC